MRDITKNWIEFLKRDMESARILLGNEYCANNVLFHCQQAVEKGLKGLLEELELDIPRTHNLYKLYNLLPVEIQSGIDVNIEQLNIIDEIYIDFRYPTAIGLLPDGFPSLKKAKEIFDMTSSIIEEILNYFEG